MSCLDEDFSRCCLTTTSLKNLVKLSNVLCYQCALNYMSLAFLMRAAKLLGRATYHFVVHNASLVASLTERLVVQ